MAYFEKLIAGLNMAERLTVENRNDFGSRSVQMKQKDQRKRKVNQHDMLDNQDQSVVRARKR